MANLQNLVLTDRAATPVAHTFVPRSVKDGIGTVVESGPVAMGENSVSISQRRTPTNRQKTVLKMAFPVVVTEVINGVSRPVVIDTDYVSIEYNFGPTSTEARRNSVQGMVEDSQKPAKVLIHNSVVKLESVWG